MAMMQRRDLPSQLWIPGTSHSIFRVRETLWAPLSDVYHIQVSAIDRHISISTHIRSLYYHYPSRTSGSPTPGFNLNIRSVRLDLFLLETNQLRHFFLAIIAVYITRSNVSFLYHGTLSPRDSFHAEPLPPNPFIVTHIPTFSLITLHHTNQPLFRASSQQFPYLTLPTFINTA